MKLSASFTALLGIVSIACVAGQAANADDDRNGQLNLSPEWKEACAKAKAMVAKLTAEEKVILTTGVGWQNGTCVGNTAAVPSINFPGLCLQDSPLGVRLVDNVSAFPAAINVAATFNRDLMYKRAVAIGEEFRGKGIQVHLGPMMNLARAPAAGRNWEGFGGDPYLSGEGAYLSVKGIQSNGVQAVAKHYINNEQEHYRDSSSSIVDDRTQHELYALPFLRTMQANVAGVMCSYNQINGSYACENDKTLNGILKNEFGFPGYVVSDWWATHSTHSINQGLDMNMPGNIGYGIEGSYFGGNLTSAIRSGNVTQSRITDAATRILAAWYLTGQDSGFPKTNFADHINVQADHKTLIREIGAASTVLLKNKKALPLKHPKSIAIVGSGAGASSKGPNGYGDRAGNEGVLAMGWGSGTAEFPYLIAPLDAITARAKTDGTTVTSSLSDSDLDAAAAAASGKSVAFVFLTADSGEGYLTVEGNYGDRNDLNAWHNGDALVQKVASVNSNTVVVVNSVGAIIVEKWIDHPNVTALVWSGLPGQEAGNALTDVLYGAYNPSGRLPYTIGKSADDYAASVMYTSSSAVPSIPYNEGLFIDYKHFDAKNIAPRFEFGFGLSYTTFKYSDLNVDGSVDGGNRQTAGSGSSLDPWLHEQKINVKFTVKNSGDVAGYEIPQLYITLPDSAKSAPLNLKGFDSVYLNPGESKPVKLTLSRFDLSIWNTVSQRWEVPSGKFDISVGASSRDLRLKGSLRV